MFSNEPLKIGGNSIIEDKRAHIELLPDLLYVTPSANKIKFNVFGSYVYILPFATSHTVLI